MQFVNRAFYDAAGQLIETQSVGRDITERKQAEAALRESEERFMTLFRFSPIPTIITRLEDGVLQDANDAFLALVGLSREEAVGQSSTSLGLWPEPAQREVLMRRVQQEGIVSGFEVPMLRKSGELGTVLVSAALVNLGGQRHIVATGLDHTERKQMRTALQQMNATLESQVTERTAALRDSASSLETQNAALERARRTLLEAQEIAHLGSWEYNTATRKTIFSEEQYRIFGFDPAGPSPSLDEMIAKCLIPGDEAWVPQAFAQAVQNRTVYELEHRIIRPDGTVRWIYNRARPSFDERGDLVRYAGTTLDITERKQAEEALVRSEERLRLAQGAAKLGSFDWNLVTGEVVWQPETEHLWGLPPGGYQGTYAHWRELVHPEDLPLAETKAQAALANPELPYEMEHRIVCPDGNVRWIFAMATTIRDATGKPVRMVGLNMDISERKQAEEALRKSEARLRLAQKSAHVGVWDWNLRDGTIEWTSELEDLYGYAHGSFPGNYTAFSDRVFAEDLTEVERQRDAAIAAHQPFDFDFRVRLPSGQIRWVNCKGAAQYGAAGQPERVFGVNVDITERKQTEEALRVLTAQMEEIREQERQRLGRELHDGLSQLLTGTKFKIGLLKRQVERRMPLDAAEIGGLENEINQALDQTREMARGLNPATLLARGLVAALEDLARTVSRTFQLECVCATAGPVVVPDQEIALHLYRIAQEAVQNAVHHAKPRQVVIRLAERTGMGCLEVLDDGRGFSPGESPAGMGLANLQTRAQAIGGRLKIRSRPGGGTAITCSWPTHAASGSPTGLVP